MPITVKEVTDILTAVMELLEPDTSNIRYTIRNLGTYSQGTFSQKLEVRKILESLCNIRNQSESLDIIIRLLCKELNFPLVDDPLEGLSLLA